MKVSGQLAPGKRRERFQRHGESLSHRAVDLDDRLGRDAGSGTVEVRPERRTALAMRWLISFSRDRNEKSMSEKLAAEVISASKGEGNAVKKKDDTHRMADANKAFAHYRW